MRHISKSFFGVKVLDDVSLSLESGEVLALLGENGAGKSTLIKILNGDYRLDTGEIVVTNQPVSFNSPRDAQHAGIQMIYQELHYAPDLSVMENMHIGRLPKKGLTVDWGSSRKRAEDALGHLNISLDVTKTMRELSVVERQIAEIARAVSADAKILVMDEPTAALTPKEVDKLFETVKTLKVRGVGIIYVSHRLDEIFRIADRVQVLRDGKQVASKSIREVTPKSLVELMIGRDLEERSRSIEIQGEKIILDVKHLNKRGAFEDISLQVKAGEIVAIFGLLGSGQITLTRSLFGAEKIDGGTISVMNHPVKISSPRDAKRAGIGFVPDDRKVRGLVLGMSVQNNITLANWLNLSRAGFFQTMRERQHAAHWVKELGIRMAGGLSVPVRYLSGGNQQKVVLSRWLEANVKVLILTEPTWGVDVGARADIYEQLGELAKKGLGVLLVSSDIQEVLAVSHRMLTMYQGRLTGNFLANEATSERLLHAASGGAA
jgi:ribose transport system ATP-binding protein